MIEFAQTQLPSIVSVIIDLATTNRAILFGIIGLVAVILLEIISGLIEIAVYTFTVGGFILLIYGGYLAIF